MGAAHGRRIVDSKDAELTAVCELNAERVAKVFKSYTDEATMAKYYGMALEYVIKNKAQIAKFWQGTNDTVVAYRQEGCVIGQTWDGPPNTMRNEGDTVKYLAPKEGALTWCDTLAITKGAKNLDQAYEYMNWALQPEVGGLMANETIAISSV